MQLKFLPITSIVLGCFVNDDEPWTTDLNPNLGSLPSDLQGLPPIRSSVYHFAGNYAKKPGLLAGLAPSTRELRPALLFCLELQDRPR